MYVYVYMYKYNNYYVFVVELFSIKFVFILYYVFVVYSVGRERNCESKMLDCNF